MIIRSAKRYINSLIAREISTITRYFDKVIQWLPRTGDGGLLLAFIESACKEVLEEKAHFPNLTGEYKTRTAVLLNGTINYNFDIQELLAELKQSLSRTSRVVIVAYNPYLWWLYKFASYVGIREGDMPTTFVTRLDLENIAKLAGFAIVKSRIVGFFPWQCLGLGNLVNRLLPLIPILRWFGLAEVVVMKPIIAVTEKKPSLTVVIPARNERGNIEDAIRRMPEFGGKLEIIFVEGHSTDGTWEEILRVSKKYSGSHTIRAYQQIGKGKADAVRLGFTQAEHDLLTILDADLTMPPEMLCRFYQAYCDGYAEFINGSRLVYPMEGNAMRPLNRLGNIFFAKALSWVLDTKICDSLCGTKMFPRHDYERMVAWRRDFGDFDPFGDFELLFPAAILGLGIIDVPVRYRDRTYGTTNISRFSHGFMLLRMTIVGLVKVKLWFGHNAPPSSYSLREK